MGTYRGSYPLKHHANYALSGAVIVAPLRVGLACSPKCTGDAAPRMSVLRILDRVVIRFLVSGCLCDRILWCPDTSGFVSRYSEDCSDGRSLQQKPIVMDCHN